MRYLTRDELGLLRLLAGGHIVYANTFLPPGKIPDPMKIRESSKVKTEIIHTLLQRDCAIHVRVESADGEMVQVVRITERGKRVAKGTENFLRDEDA